MPDVSEMEHDEWQVLEEEEKKEKEEKKKSSSEPLPEEPPAEAAAEEVLSSQGKVVEELDLEDLEEFEESGGEASPAVVAADSATGSSDLGGLVEELSREVRLLKEENREIRGMLEGIFVAAGSQIDILRVMRKELSGGENSEPLAEDRPDREGG